MKKLFLFLVVCVFYHAACAQNSVTDYLGTWKGECGDTIFTIKLLEGDIRYNGTIVKILGGYSVMVNEEIIDNYLDVGTTLPLGVNAVDYKVYINASYFIPPRQYVGFTFYDQRKKHFNGEGILGGKLEYIAPNQLHWTLDEKYGIWCETEGDEDAEEVQPIGFSVPTDIILTKVE